MVELMHCKSEIQFKDTIHRLLYGKSLFQTKKSRQEKSLLRGISVDSQAEIPSHLKVSSPIWSAAASAHTAIRATDVSQHHGMLHCILFGQRCSPFLGVGKLPGASEPPFMLVASDTCSAMIGW